MDKQIKAEILFFSRVHKAESMLNACRSLKENIDHNIYIGHVSRDKVCVCYRADKQMYGEELQDLWDAELMHIKTYIDEM